MNRFLRNTGGILLAIGLTACAGDPQPATPSQPRMLGADRDPHGCIPSAGYSWCARERACVRPWELAKEKALDRGAAAFEAYCTSQP